MGASMGMTGHMADWHGSRRQGPRRSVALAIGFAVLLFAGPSRAASDIKEPPRWTSPKDFTAARDWDLKATNLVPHGTHKLFYPLVPGHKHVLEKPDHLDGHYRRETTVLDTTEEFDVPGFGSFRTAVVQDDEIVDGVLNQRILTWLAIDRASGGVFIFGEEVWEIDDDGKRAFASAWRVGEPAGDGLAEPGLLMPGLPMLGGRYVFYGNDSTAYGGSEIMETGIEVMVPAGRFRNCMRVRDQGLRVLSDITDRTWCPGVGLTVDSSDGKLVISAALPRDNPASDVSGVGKPRDASLVPKPVPKISTEKATEIALQRVPGKVTSVKIERKRGKSVYAVEIMTTDRGEKDVFVDIQSGEIVGIE